MPAENSNQNKPLVGVIMGSQSDWPTMQNAVEVLQQLEIPYETQVVSAHRTPDLMFDYANNAEQKGLQVIIAGAGGAAHLPGMVASKVLIPVIGVPIKTSALGGKDSLLSIVQMPGGVPVATMAIGDAGAKNAGVLAAQILSNSNPELKLKLAEWRRQLTAEVANNSTLE